MSGLFITTLVFAGLAGVGALVSRRTKANAANATPRDQEDAETTHFFAVWARRILLGVTLLFLALASFSIVPVNHIGIQTAFGRPVAAHHNGFVLHAPWASVTDFDATNQPQRFEGDGADRDGEQVEPRVALRLSGQAEAWVDATVTWKMPQDKAMDLFRTYKGDFQRVRRYLVVPAARQGLFNTFAGFDPLTTDVNPTALSATALGKVRELIGTQVEVVKVEITAIDFNDVTDKALADKNTERANAAVAQAREATAAAEAKANAAVAGSISDDPEVLVNKCLDVARDAIRAGKDVEPGLCMAGGAPPVFPVR